MGGSHVGKIRLFFNILTVWMLTGFWHGADWNFILWGLYFAVLLILEKNFFLKKLEGSRVFSRVYVLFFVLISFVIFNGATLSHAFSQIGGLFGIGGYPLVSNEAVFCLKNYAFVLLIAAAGATPFPKTFAEKYGWTRLLTPAITLLLLLLVTAHLVSGSFNPFLYFRF
jgi:alginate O-acetyltransferase complex protein AlgI